MRGDKRKEFDVGQHVRILADEKIRRGIGYKSYKGQQFSEKVYVITKKTKKKPVKYRVGKKWFQGFPADSGDSALFLCKRKVVRWLEKKWMKKMILSKSRSW